MQNHIVHKKQSNKAGFTLIELIVTVGIIGILAALGIPKYIGYVDTSKTTVVKNNLRAIYLQQQEYMQRNNVFYKTAATCTNATALINTNLFSGQQILTDKEGFYYCVTQTTTSDFIATAKEGSSSRNFTINNLNATNF